MSEGRSTIRRLYLAEGRPLPFLEHEKQSALKTLTEESSFHPVNQNAPAPYDLTLSIHDGRLLMEMTDAGGCALPALILSVKPYTRLVRDYFLLIESYETVRRQGTPCQLEAVDMGRRGLHDEGAALLIERLNGKITLDHPTARRLFTLICVLHGQHFPLF